MIISHKHKFIFIKNRKTAGTSLEIALSSICGEQDIITPISKGDELVRKRLNFRTAQNYKIPFYKYSLKEFVNSLQKIKKQRFQFYSHIPCIEIIEYVDKEVWDTYFKFTVERNPFDKVVSLYYWRRADSKYKSISEFILRGGLKSISSYDFYTINGIIAVDKIYQYENLDYMLADLTKRFNLKKKLELPDFKAKSTTRKINSHQEALDDKAIKLIEIIFAREIHLFDYKF